MKPWGKERMKPWKQNNENDQSKWRVIRKDKTLPDSNFENTIMIIVSFFPTFEIYHVFLYFIVTVNGGSDMFAWVVVS